jgi:hypothetical protein
MKTYYGTKFAFIGRNRVASYYCTIKKTFNECFFTKSVHMLLQWMIFQMEDVGAKPKAEGASIIQETI